MQAHPATRTQFVLCPRVRVCLCEFSSACIIATSLRDFIQQKKKIEKTGRYGAAKTFRMAGS